MAASRRVTAMGAPRKFGALSLAETGAPPQPASTGSGVSCYCPSDIRVDVGLGLAAGMGDGALLGVADRLRVFPQRARLEVVPPRRPGFAALGQLGVAQRNIDRPLDGIDRDRIAILEHPDR